MKRYILDMSMQRDRATKLMTSYSSVIIEHIIKLLVYSDSRPEDVSGWITSVANWISKVDDITLKPSNKKLKEQDIESTLFSFIGDELKDFMSELYGFEADNLSGRFNHDGKGTYPTFDIDYELAEDLMNICLDIKEQTMPLLLDKQPHTISEYRSIVQSIFDKIN